MSRLPGPIDDEVRRELGRFGPEAGLAEIVAAWPQAVGAAIAANAWPARVARDGTLHVAVASSAWAFELTQLGSTVLARLSEHLEEAHPRAIRFTVGRIPEPGAEAAKVEQRTVPKVTEVHAEAAAEIAREIDDPDLRVAVARAVAASLAAREGPPADRAV